MKIAILFPLSLVGFAALAAPDLVKVGPQPLKAAEFRVGQRIADLELVDLAGNRGKLSDYRGSAAIVIAMNMIDCPVCRKFAPALNQIQKDYEPKNVAFLMVNTNAEVSLDKLKEGVKELGFTARYLPDLDHSVANALLAQSTAEVFVLDRARTLAYRGPVSDQYGLGYSLAAPRNHTLTDALDQVLGDVTVVAPALTAPGCALGLPPVEAPESTVTYHHQVSRILQTNCEGCHRAGEAAPFALSSYADAKGHAGMIRFVVSRGVMPPWTASPHVGTWANDATLTPRDKRLLLRWIAEGTVPGDAEDAPVPRRWPQGWKIGQPDRLFTVPSPYPVPASGVVPYRYALVDTGLTEDTWVTAAEIRSTHGEVVHHVIVYVRPPGLPNDSFLGVNPKTDSFLLGQAPGQSANVFPKGFGKLIPKGSKLLFETHLTPGGVAVEAQPRIALKTSAVALRRIWTAAVVNHEFQIPPGASNHEVVAKPFTFTEPTRLTGLTPHMHLRGKSFRMELQYPDGKTETVLDVPRYDFNWQLQYVPRAPMDVPAGTVLKATAWFDNSIDNPANPDPTKTVGWGEQSFDEMMIGFFEGYAIHGVPGR